MAKLIKGVNDLQTVNPTLAIQWSAEKNGDLHPSNISANSHQKVWWSCPKCEYEWQATVASRSSGAGCPACSGRVPIPGKTDLATLAPGLLDEWDYEKNVGITPSQVTCFSSKKIWWKCGQCNYSWFATISGRTKDKKGCPVCGHRTVVPGVNDLKTKNPELAGQWDYERNGEFSPEKAMPNSARKVWWMCPDCGHRWKAQIASRNAGANCPRCAKAWQTSLPEQIIFYYIKKIFPDTVNSYKPDWLGRGEIDIFIPSIHLGIEYDGIRWHKDSNRDIAKDKIILSHNIKIIRVRERGLPELNDGSYCISVVQNYKDYSYMNSSLRLIMEYISTQSPEKCDVNIEVNRDIAEIMASFANSKQERSLAVVMPELLKEWDYNANGELSPYKVAAGSDYKVHWRCKQCGQTWVASVGSRVNGRGCPVCTGKTVIQGLNDLATMRPHLVSEWNQEGNVELTPQNVTAYSTKRASWKCTKCGYVWEARIADRSKGAGCPACAGKVVLVGKTDLQTLIPELAAEWDTEKNEITPSEVTPGSNRKAWWICGKCGHSWQAVIYSRVAGRGCPACREAKRVGTGRLSHKEFEVKLHKKNSNVKVIGEYVTSKTKIECECLICGKKWFPTPNALLRGSGCPICSRKKSARNRTV